MDSKRFKKIIWEHYRRHGRDLPWRQTRDHYKIMVSEVMLQQTQVVRVIPKYQSFIKQFPTFKSLAQAKQSEVIKAWQGLGYNRRALNLQKAARLILAGEKGKLPGIGPNTAGSIGAFAFNQPTVFIETNIRTVYLHFFFPRSKNVSDKKLWPLIAKTVNQTNPREWYFALMDYGVKLKSEVPNPSRRSKHHTKQSKFAGSNRQKRGAILRQLSQKSKIIFKTDLEIVKKLETEGFIKKIGRYHTLV